MKKKYVKVRIRDKDLVYGDGVTKTEARKAYIQGWMESARKKKKTKYKGYAGFDFYW